MDDSPLSVALACAARGWHVFPCKPDKTPWTKHGFKDATTDEAELRRLWGLRPKASIGIATGASGLAVIDLDVKGEFNGLDAWHELTQEFYLAGLENTTLVETPSGGLHVYYRANGHRIGSNASKLAPGIDVRAEGGYVIAAGSPGYLYVDGHGPETIAALPPILGKKLAYATPTPLIPPEALTIAEGGRNAALASLGGTMRKRGMDPAAILAALLAENKAKCKPPLPESEVATIAKSVGRYAPAEEVAAVLPGDDIGHTFIDWAVFWDRDRSEAEWVYPDVLARGRGHAIYAIHKAGKSLLMLYLAAEIATGTEKCVVVYLDYEMTEADVFDRLDDMGYGMHADLSRLRYALLPTLPPLDTAAGGKALAELVDDVQVQWPEHHIVVVIDTVSRAVKGKENDADTFRDFYFHTGIRLKRRGITWARLDHGGKAAEQGQRGSSSKGDDVDVVWKLGKTQNGISLRRELARMSWVPAEVTLRMFPEPLRYERLAGDWPEGTIETAIMLDVIDKKRRSRGMAPLKETTAAAIKALREIGEGTRRNVVCAAVRWRKEEAEDALRKRFPMVPEPDSPNAEIEPENGSGTAGNRFCGQTRRMGVSLKRYPFFRPQFRPRKGPLKGPLR